jgi:UDP-N-acetylglucosamine--N-acetylmuramyl-(pentapeptide) pyrophosphoryl-undecaprenol N-acetylglucosamine transferase
VSCASNAAYFIHGRGRGHASRAPVVYQALLDRGFSVRVYAGGDAAGQLAEAGIPFTRRDPLLPSRSAVVKLVKRTYSDVLAFFSDRPQLVISDGDHAALLAARTYGIPNIAIGHDLVFGAHVELPTLPRRALASQRLNSLPTSAANLRLAVHFLPLRSRDWKLRIARPDVAPLTAQDHDGSIVCYFRDDNGERITAALAERGFAVNWFTAQSVSVPGVQVLKPSVVGFRAAVARAKAVVGSAGSNVLAECVAQQKPVLALYRGSDTEQQLNALLVEQGGVGVGATFENFAAPMATFVDRLNHGRFATVDIHSLMAPLSSTVGQALDEIITPPSRR